MGKRCDLCGRSATAGASRSHSKIKTLKRQNINLQSKNIDGIKLKVCTSCIRTIAKIEREREAKKLVAKTGKKVKSTKKTSTGSTKKKTSPAKKKASKK
ncbi:50S ribosomal protein L28 [Candidatus Falkowbacteria bacterium]|uniref:Large ribosomal subunit protein bL28 n=1 Tax=Candidatus Falkowbacteria bacterium CG10_big_fil_rev_8_21_14_0_10_37_18 TaxID=1974562 RepID=A0A2H0VB55_9BACT|nr:50S ribosomal protein L28 [Candidatus Falkowbacteria bacterium]NCQ12554.1 50S ribosomal protein L28 [Candidatus Falkowbacteria bacterium]OIO06017.1 MAG: hypothetical protein AUJ26_01870 [Candidatus Falkowbacteria bacterium CG1_02_37_21]PIR95540.1 MAG: hypothetical protein COT93_01900 [Candidatus Falkowbacteria bacterium CG10_big_fil_rev_8_21_14_0_10_37_18]